MKTGFLSKGQSKIPFVYENGTYYDASDFIREGDFFDRDLRKLTENFEKKRMNQVTGQFTLDIPIKRVNQVRDFYAFEEHVRNSRNNRGLTMLNEWYNVPVYYYSNKEALIPSEQNMKKPNFTEKLDLEVEVGIIIGKSGYEIKMENAMDYVFGLTLMNDWSARDLWAAESKLNLGPSKSKDFATSIGPFITTKDELNQLWDGRSYDIEISSYINGKEFSRSNLNDIYFSIPKIIEYASLGTALKAGDILMTGTLPGGCIFEKGDANKRWLEIGDLVEISSSVLGTLSNRVI